MRLFSTDIDGTIYDGSDSLARFRDYWSRWDSGPERPFLVYNTGRSLDDTLTLIETENLPRPDYLICGVGTVIHRHEGDLLDAWHDELAREWDYDVVHAAAGEHSPARPQPEECQNPFKSSWWWEDADTAAIDDLLARISESGIRAQAVYSSNRDLDFLPASANKGNAVAWLADRIGVPLNDVVVAGDSGNDASMYRVPGVRGIVVANAEPELVASTSALPVHRARARCADGVIEGLSVLLDRVSD